MKDIETYNICFLGQTGFGKSSLINELFGTVFNTDPLVSCTKELYSVSKLIETSECERLVTVYDTPGIGEFSTNEKYQVYYDYAASVADHIVLVVSLDRVDATSQDLLESISKYIKGDHVKFTIALNRIDSTGVMDDVDYISWDTKNNKPSERCMKKINARRKTIIANYLDDIDFLPFEIIPVCAIRKYGISELRNRLYMNI